MFDLNCEYKKKRGAFGRIRIRDVFWNWTY